MIPVEEARARILAAFKALPAETVSLSQALGRVLAEPVVSRIDQPPKAVSAMDGYAVRAEDTAGASEAAPVVLTEIGEAPAGRAFEGAVQPGETVRIFTGGPLPAGADAIVIQENTVRDGNRVSVRQTVEAGRFVRPAGLDFRRGDKGVAADRLLSVRDIGLAAAMNVPWVRVRRRPRIAILTTGDEVVMPGDPLGPDQIVSSNTLALSAFVTAAGGEPTVLGIAPDDSEALRDLALGASGADLLVTTGGASVGKHDLVQRLLGAEGESPEAEASLDFWKIAMRPGKPLLFGRVGATPLLGLPGNPVSAVVCALLFLGPAIEAMLGLPEPGPRTLQGVLGADLGANDARQDYLRATLARDGEGRLVATPFPRQDSSMLATLTHADALLVRPPKAPPAAAGDPVTLVPLTAQRGGC